MAHGPPHSARDEPSGPRLEGTVEVDETYLGGKPRRGSRKTYERGRGTSKTPGVALVERDGDIVVKAVVSVSAKNLK